MSDRKYPIPQSNETCPAEGQTEVTDINLDKTETKT